MHHQLKRLSRRTPVYDHAGELLFMADPDHACQLMLRRDVGTIESKKRIKGLRFQGPDCSRLLGGKTCLHRRRLGEPHRSDNYFNPRGVWSFDGFPSSLQAEFLIVVAGCMKYETIH
jgi:hypothetical protein